MSLADAALHLTTEGFFARAAERLDAEPASEPIPRYGDHHLNPGWAPAAGMRFREAAVLIPVVASAGEPSIILTQRAAALTAHPGQVAFPGGKIDPGDADAAAAALREAEEEIGLDPALVTPIGYLRPYLTGTGYHVVPVVGRVAPVHRLVPNPAEVDAVFEVPLSFLMSEVNHRRASAPWKGGLRHFYEIPFEERRIWGVTAGIIRSLYERIML